MHNIILTLTKISNQYSENMTFFSPMWKCTHSIIEKWLIWWPQATVTDIKILSNTWTKAPAERFCLILHSRSTSQEEKLWFGNCRQNQSPKPTCHRDPLEDHACTWNIAKKNKAGHIVAECYVVSVEYSKRDNTISIRLIFKWVQEGFRMGVSYMY